ncbi:MAG: amidohydrolase family protein [Rhodospirillales bacterium]|nr:amidohydrolase family protein [Rhodospirillales bacterium]HJO72445.1 amidohydrolase family protein [Rhodospirillales bacterium]
MPEAVDFLIDGTVITMDGGDRVIRDGAVAVKGERIAAVGKAAELRERYEAKRILGGPRHYVTPGLIDCHNHLAQGFVREFGLEDLPNIYRICIPAEIAMSGDDARVSADVMISQLLRAGVTTLAETTCTVAHEGPIADAVMESGIRCAMARGQGDRKGHLAGNYDQVDGRSSKEDDPKKLADDLAACEAFIKTWQQKGEGRLRPWIHTGTVVACSDDRFVQAKDLADRFGTGLMTHINRDREEIEYSAAVNGVRPLEHLQRLGVLGPNFLAIHAMLTTDREIKALAEAAAKVAHSPLACNIIVSAITNVTAMRSAGVTVGLGCDTIVNDLWRIMGYAFTMHTQGTGIPLYDPLSFTTEDAFAMATRDAARALSWDEEIGSLEAGKQADIAVIDGDNVRLSPSHNPIAVLVQYAVGTDVESVLVAGRLVVDGGEVTTIDQSSLLEEATALSGRLADVLEPRRYRPLASKAVFS